MREEKVFGRSRASRARVCRRAGRTNAIMMGNQSSRSLGTSREKKRRRVKKKGNDSCVTYTHQSMLATVVVCPRAPPPRTDRSFAKRRDGDVPSLASRAHWASRSSMMESLMPLPLGKEIIGLLPVPMTKTLVARGANS